MAYINVDKARKHLRVDCLAKYPTTYIDGLLAAAEELTRIPTADVVEVVRCKNCTHGVDYCGRTMCGKNARRINDGIVGLTATSPEHFCSYGERSNT